MSKWRHHPAPESPDWPDDGGADAPPPGLPVLDGGEVEDGGPGGAGAQGEQGDPAGLVHPAQVLEEGRRRRRRRRGGQSGGIKY